MITALTAQNTKGVTAIHDVPADFVAAQIDAVFSDLDGRRGEDRHAVATGRDRGGRGRARPHWRQTNVVLDPVMVATSGDRLLAPDAIDVLKRVLIPRALVVTPNLPEAAALLDAPIAPQRSRDARAGRAAARARRARGADQGRPRRRRRERRPAGRAERASRGLRPSASPPRNTHGTGCTLSSAIAAGLAKGLDLAAAVREAKAYVTAAIAAADRLAIGSGHGPGAPFSRLVVKPSNEAHDGGRA